MVGAVVEMLHAFWIVMRTGIVFVTVAEKTLVDARPNVTRTAVAIALMLISVSPLGIGLLVVVPLKSRAHRGPFDIARLQVRGLEQAVCQGRVRSIFDTVMAVTLRACLYVTRLALSEVKVPASDFRRASKNGRFLQPATCEPGRIFTAQTRRNLSLPDVPRAENPVTTMLSWPNLILNGRAAGPA
jgi:hypothetical protein